MKAVVLFESLTGNTRKAGELIAANLQQVGWGVTDVSPVRQPNHAAIQDADVAVIGTWVHGLFVVGTSPFNAAAISQLPSLKGKKVAVYCTYALKAGKSIETMERIGVGLGAESLGGLLIKRSKLADGAEDFAARLASVTSRR